MDKETLWRKIKSIHTLSTLPEIYSRIASLVDDPKASASTLASVISRDQTLTAKLLKVANSPFYSASSIRITSITHAVALLGFRATKNLTLSVSIFELFSDFKEDLKAIARGLWHHSIACAVGSKIIAQHIRYKDPEEMFVAGLLHDIGKIVELQFMPEKFREIVSLAENGSFISAEQKVLHYTHTYIGKLLATQWRLAPQLIASIEWHHNPDAADEFQLQTAIVHVADVFSRALDLGSGGDKKIPIISDKAWELLQIKTNAIEPILRKLRKEWKESVSFLFPS